jgi:hypothetical protein
MLVKLRPGVNFTDDLCSALTCTDSKSANKYCQALSLLILVLLGFVRVKAACKILVKLRPGAGGWLAFRKNGSFSISAAIFCTLTH